MSKILHIQSYLRGGGTLDALKTDLGINAKRHEDWPNLVLLKYDQIASPMASPIVRECRGIILDEGKDWAVVARAFDKFFNHGEGHAAEIDWATARVQEKVDGSMVLLFKHEGVWNVATTGTPDASGDINGAGKTFASYFWETFGAQTDGTLPFTDRYCFMFELTGPLNRIVVPHMKAHITLLGARDMETGEEVPPQAVAHLFHGIPAVREFSLTALEDVIATFAQMSPLSQEGYVIVDAQFRRIKVKHPGYIALHHAKDGLGDKAFVEIARSGEVSEVETAFPEFRPMLEQARTRFEALVTEVEADYARHRDIPVQKDFALAVNGTRVPAALFAVRAGKVASIREFCARKMRIELLMQTLGYKAAA